MTLSHQDVVLPAPDELGAPFPDIGDIHVNWWNRSGELRRVQTEGLVYQYHARHAYGLFGYTDIRRDRAPTPRVALERWESRGGFWHRASSFKVRRDLVHVIRDGLAEFR